MYINKNKKTNKTVFVSGTNLNNIRVWFFFKYWLSLEQYYLFELYNLYMGKSLWYAFWLSKLFLENYWAKQIEYFKMLFDGKLTNHLKSLIIIGTDYSSFIKVVYDGHVQEVAHQNEREQIFEKTYQKTTHLHEIQ